MATEGVMLRDGGNLIAGQDFSSAGSLTAVGSNSTGQYLAVRMSTAADRTVLVGTAGQGCTGIIQNNPTTGFAADVCLAGVTKAVFGGTVLAGDKLKVTTNGRLISITASGDVAVAETYEAGAIGEVHTVHLFGGRFSF